MEEWKVYKIIHFKNKGDRIYEVSNYGNVRLNGILIDLSKYEHQKYYCIGTFKVHRAVAELFVPNPNNYTEVDHKNGDPHDNRAENLQWCTHEMNLNNPITRKRNSEAQKIIREQTKWKEHQSASQKIVQNRPEVKMKKSMALKGKEPWNKGMKTKKI